LGNNLTNSARIEREKQTVEIMIKMYCKKNHSDNQVPCEDCSELIDFANIRIDKCIFHEDKPVCSECEVHCYRKDMRDKIKKVMSYSGPRMMYQHPILGLIHLIDKRRFKYIDPKTYKKLNIKENKKPRDI
jgi:hypothetical protein